MDGWDQVIKNRRQALGRWGEQAAADYLRRKGYMILDRNARTPYGEIDLVVKQESPLGGDGAIPGGADAAIVFVEVKTRSSDAYGLPEDAITQRKREHLLASAQANMAEHPEYLGDWRIDVIGIQRPRPGDEPVILHFENALA